MDAVLVEAFLPISSVDAVEKALLGLGVCNISVAKVRGYSRCVDFLSRDHLTEQAKVEVFAAREDGMRVADAIREAAEPSEGVVAIVPTQAAFKVGSASWNSPDSPDSSLRCAGLRIAVQTPLG